jgi:hypothetical protein
MLRRLLRRKRVAPLTGAPPVRRLKSYSSETGYVYQYFYLGQRPYGDGPSGLEFCFDVSSDRRTSVVVSVYVPDSSLREWEESRLRKLASNERYAIAKMALFQAFDERPPEAMKQPVEVRPADVEGILGTLGVE